MTLQEGLAVPDFELQDQHGRSVVLSSFRGTHAVVLMFYPFAFSRVCTGELSEVRDHQASLVSADVQLLAVSCDPMFALRTFADRDGLEFPLLSDFWPHGEVSRAFGVFDEKRGCSRRSTFIVDRDGVLRWSVHNPLPEARDLTAYTRVLADLSQGR